MKATVSKNKFYPLLAFYIRLEADFDLTVSEDVLNYSPINVFEKFNKYGKNLSDEYPYGLNDDGKVKFINYIVKWDKFIK